MNGQESHKQKFLCFLRNNFEKKKKKDQQIVKSIFKNKRGKLVLPDMLR